MNFVRILIGLCLLAFELLSPATARHYLSYPRINPCFRVPRTVQSPAEEIKPLCSVSIPCLRGSQNAGGKEDEAEWMEGVQSLKTERWGAVDWCEPGFVAGMPCTITSCVILQKQICAQTHADATWRHSGKLSKTRALEHFTKTSNLYRQNEMQHLWPGLTLFLFCVWVCACVCGRTERQRGDERKENRMERQTALHSQAFPSYKLKSVSQTAKKQLRCSCSAQKSLQLSQILLSYCLSHVVGNTQVICGNKWKKEQVLHLYKLLGWGSDLWVIIVMIHLVIKIKLELKTTRSNERRHGSKWVLAFLNKCI